MELVSVLAAHEKATPPGPVDVEPDPVTLADVCNVNWYFVVVVVVVVVVVAVVDCCCSCCVKDYKHEIW